MNVGSSIQSTVLQQLTGCKYKPSQTKSSSELLAEVKQWILLDCQSTINSFCSPKYVSDIKLSKTPILLSTNPGDCSLNQEAHVPKWGKVWFDEQMMTNISNLASMEEKCRVTFDSAVESRMYWQFRLFVSVNIFDMLLSMSCESTTEPGLIFSNGSRRASSSRCG
jgi:hypothetical protein